MCIQDSAAGSAGTMDSTAAAAEWLQSLSLLAGTDRPEMTHTQIQSCNHKQRGNPIGRDRHNN